MLGSSQLESEVGENFGNEDQELEIGPPFGPAAPKLMICSAAARL